MTNNGTVITRSSSGIGITEGLAAAGYNIVLSGIECVGHIESARTSLEVAERTLSITGTVMQVDGWTAH